ncbi:Trm112 family protein [Capsulimonas corticalis]|nr:Trm112 family protein [Capsulimonas corticalis]
MVLDPKLLEILACPACDDRPPLRLEGETLVCDECHRVYPIHDGIPILLPDEALQPEQTDVNHQ